MKKSIKLVLLSSMIFTLGGSLTSCKKPDKIVLRIINSEDYIYLQDETDPESAPNMTDQFKDYIHKNYPKYGEIEVVYDTSDTNETLYSELQTGKSNYDLMNVSDYMAQKIVSGKYAVPLYREAGADLSEPAKYDMIPNYKNYASKEIRRRVDSINAPQRDNKNIYLKDYAVGYMWGTLGILFNPEYAAFEDIGSDQVITDMMSFDSLWDPTYKGTISIKNSMRDTYAVGLLHTYKDEIQENIDKYQSGDISLKEYQENFEKIFNRCEQENVDDIAKSLDELKKNIFGLEVDSGKEDIITQKIGINLAWSGDAVYSMDQGEDEEKVGEDTVELCYSVPENGSNIWCDVWVMPNCPRSQEQYELAHLFLDFISDPANAAQNMDYTGYTSFIGGDDIIDLVRSWYDIRYEEVFFIDDNDNEYQIYSLNTTEATAVSFNDLVSTYHNSGRDEEKLYYYVPTGEEEEEFEPTVEDLLEQDHPVYILDDDGEETEDIKTYGDLTICDDPDSELEEVDLSYFFDERTLTRYVVGKDTIFYSDCYLPFTYEDEEGNEVQNISVGRQFFCQYPNEETINRCAVMRDYGDNNEKVMKMWENFKSDPLPTWAIVLLSIFIAGILGVIGYFVVNKVLINNIRKKRKLNS